MDCPVCGHQLLEQEAGGVVVDVCHGGCGGIWFDNFELKKFDEPHEAEGQALLDIPRNESVHVDHSLRRNCPTCNDVVMMRHLFSPKDEVEVDECPQCAGIWLDAGELGAIRNKFASEEERNVHAQACFEELFGTQLAAMSEESEEKLRKAERIARIFRFICPTYWIPGDQEWGAF